MCIRDSDEGAQQTILDRLGEQDVDFASDAQDVAVEDVEGADTHAERTAHLGQAALPSAYLKLRGDDDARRGRQPGAQGAGLRDEVGGFPARGGG